MLTKVYTMVSMSTVLNVKIDPALKKRAQSVAKELGLPMSIVVAASLLALTIGEMIYAVLLWPIGYLASGFLLTWCWYIGWLQLRYALTQQGVQWKRQAPFLILNGILLLIYLLFIVRWK